MLRIFTRNNFQALLLAVVALGVTSHAVAQAPVRIMPLGDSITAGPGCWRAYLWNRLRTAGHTNIDFVGSTSDGGGCNPGFAYDFDHEGHSGFSITGIADQNQLPPWLTAANPSIVVVHLGTNDMWGHFIPLQTKLTAFTKLIGQMRAHNPSMKIIVAQIIPMDPSNCTTCNADVIEFNSALPAWAAGLTTAQSPITLVDQFTGFDVGADTGDRVHPVTSGFIKMSDRFFPAVAQALNGTPPGPALTVTRAGAGTGNVTSSPAGINCGSTCSASYANGTSVTLTAVPASGSTFAGWSGACTGTGVCTVSMTQARSVTATFNGATIFPLAVTRAGTGTGTVTSTPAGISCGTTCTANYAGGTSVTLTAAAAGGSTFAGWNGACTGTGICTVSMTVARNVTATFNSTAVTFPLNVTRVITAGAGTVTSNPAGINCGTACSANYANGTSVTLTATPGAGSLFQGWSGACTGTATTCAVAMTQARNVTATFMGSVPPVSLTVTLAGTGSGTVTSNPGGINCPTACIAGFQSGNVTLTATAAAGSTFAGWSGACTGTGTCTVVMSQPRAVTATFNGGGTGATCANPVTFTNNTGNFNTTGAACYRTNATVNGWGCSNFDGRTLTVGGQARTCGQLPLVRSADGYYYFAVTAGTFPWASLYAW
jgi:lysophospholipase L1-like esterase